MMEIYKKFIFAEPISDEIAVNVAKVTRSMTYLYGGPWCMITDQDSDFVNELYFEYL